MYQEGIMKSQNGRISLPKDIVSEVLLRLPALSVLRFKSVCKLFAQVSDDPSFVSSHIERSRASPPDTSLILNLPGSSSVSILRGAQKRRNNAAYTMELRVLKASLMFDDEIDWRRGPCASCNGLLVFKKGSNSYVVGNPLTGEWELVVIPGVSRAVHLLGFYFYPPTGQYRFLLSIREHYWEPPVYGVFVLGENAVRPINSFPRTRISSKNCDEPFLFHGKLLWLSIDQEVDYQRVGLLGRRAVSRSVCKSIVVFDLETEQFSDVPTPEEIDGQYIALLELDGTLYLRFYHSESRMYVWMLDEKEIWTEKEVLIEDILFSDANSEAQNYIPVTCSYNGGKFLMLKSKGNESTSHGRQPTLHRLDVAAILTPNSFSILDEDMTSNIIYGKIFNESLEKIQHVTLNS